ncbi:hypothetical protein AURDEDRAFT_188902 [Auricularia subglabra TFB-10046 SS5]|uniref:Uncharacterized protein n=1 Tax=Auricularia subglabra (strain TFB-10046 / SS5) TaxID=717982 RepID=J0WS45_AURST|nr:hypothetical protein AURDEDRAFT_188902 [Auricularia subglabra TFB-10046 SS5]
MPRYALFFCAGVIPGVLAQGGGLGSNVRMVAHTDSNIHYSSVANGLGHGECTRVPSPCAGKWWSENNEGGTASLVRTRHATTGPGSSLSFAFSGSSQLILGGKRDSSVSASVSLNGASYPLSRDTDSLIFSTNNLNPSTTYNVLLTYGGHGTLGFAGFAVDRNARVSQSQGPTTQPPGPSQLPAPTLQPVPPSPEEPTRTPPAQDPKPSDTTKPGGGTSSTASPAPDPSPDPAEGGQQPNDSPGAHDGSSPSNTRSAPPPSDTASAPDNGNSNAVTPPTDDDGSAGDQPGNAGAGSPQEGKKRMNTGAVAGGLIAGLLALILLGALAVWYARRRVRARRAPSYAFRHGPGEFAPAPHWTQRPVSPQPEMAEKPLQ